MTGLVLFDKDAGTFSQVNVPTSALAADNGFGLSGQSDYQAFVFGGRDTPALFGVSTIEAPPSTGPVVPVLDSPVRTIISSDLIPRSP